MPRERLGILALLAAFIGGALLVTAAGGPPWLALGYAALGACVAAYRLRRGGRRRPAGYEPGPRINAAGQLAFGPAPRPAPAEPVRPPTPSPSPSLEASAPVTRRFEPASQIVASVAALGYALIDRTTRDGSDEVATAIRSECAERRLRLARSRATSKPRRATRRPGPRCAGRWTS